MTHFMCKCYNKLSVDIFKPKADCRAYLLYAEEMFLQCVFVQGALPSQPLQSALPWPPAPRLAPCSEPIHP